MDIQNQSRVLRPLGVLYYLYGVNMNITTDQALVKEHGFAAYTIQIIRARNASIALSTAAGGIYTGAGKTGTIIVSASQTYSTMGTGANGPGQSASVNVAGFGRFTTDPIFSLTTAQGSDATMDLEIIGWEVP